MLPTQIQDNVVRGDTPAVYAYYIVKSARHYPLALVCDSDDKLVGVIGKNEFDVLDLPHKTCGDICQRNYSILKNSSEDELYSKARKLFAENHILTLPIIDEDGRPIRLFGRFQAFFLEQHRSVPRHHYAMGLMEAATIAKSRGRLSENSKQRV